MTMPGNATPGNASTPNSRSAVSRAAFNFGSSPGAPRAMRCTVAGVPPPSPVRLRAKAPVDTSGSGSRICGRSVVNCDVAKSALTPTIVNSCSRLSSSVTITRSPIGSVAGKSSLASGSEITATGAALMRSSARDRSTAQQRRADGLEKIFADARDVRRHKLLSTRAGDAKEPVVEVDRHAIGDRNRAHTAGLLQIVANPADRQSQPLALSRMPPAGARPPIRRSGSRNQPCAPGRASRR